MKKNDSRPRQKRRENKPGIRFKVTEDTELMKFLIAQMPHKNRNNIKSLLARKQVLVDGQMEKQFNHPLVSGQVVEINPTRMSGEQKFKEYTIIFEDDDIIVIEKQAGLLSIATKDEKRATAYSLLSNHVKKANKENKIFIVHRLDRETSGLMLFAKNEVVKHKLQETWNDTVLERTYIAVVEGKLEKPKGTIVSYLFEDKVFRMHSSQNPSKGDKAVTNYSVLKKNNSYSMLKVNLETGRKNQIRVHMQDIGHSIIGDKKYGATRSPIKRLGLHAQQLSFVHPVTGQKLNFETKIPRVFLGLL